MKLFRALLCLTTALATASFADVNPQLHQVKRVYILAMGSGMDQFLANQLTKAGLFEVVTDPKAADAILTDNVGEGFQKKLDDVYPPPPSATKPPEATKPAGDTVGGVDVGDTSGDTKSAAKKDGLAGIDFSGGGGFKSSGFGHSRGNIFVVDRNTRVVLWSIYERPKDSTPGELTKTANRVVKHLKDDLIGKKAAE